MTVMEERAMGMIKSTSGEMRLPAGNDIRGGVAPALDQARLSLFAVRLYSGLCGLSAVIFLVALVMVTRWPIVAINRWPYEYLDLYPGWHPVFVAMVLGTGLLGLGLLGAAVRLTAISHRRGCPPNWTPYTLRWLGRLGWALALAPFLAAYYFWPNDLDHRYHLPESPAIPLTWLYQAHFAVSFIVILLVGAVSAWACGALLQALTIHRLLRDEATPPHLHATDRPVLGE